MIMQSTWESTLLAAAYGLTNGGTAGVIWMTVGVIFGALAMVSSIAEMASMQVPPFSRFPFLLTSGRAPTAGGQYHWVSEFAPPSVQKPMSYIIGWLACLGWVTGCPSAAQLTSTLVQGLVLLKNPDADFTQLYQTTLLVMLFLLGTVAFNIFLARSLPTAEGIFLIVHILGYFAYLIVFWIMSDHAPAKDVFTTFADEGGWGNQGLATLVGTITCIASASRQVWAFARDRGFPVSEFIEHVRPGMEIPVNAILVVLGISLAITALNFGSPVALNAIISLSNAALLISYIASISLVLLKRIRKQPLLPRRWSLGKYGLAVNVVALCFLWLSFIMSFFPFTPNPAPADMNWAIVILFFVIFAAGVDYYFRAHKKFIAPVALVKNGFYD